MISETPCDESKADVDPEGLLHSGVKSTLEARVTVEEGLRAIMPREGRTNGVQCCVVVVVMLAVDHGGLRG